MASTVNPTSKYVSSYSDKSDEWLRQRLEYKEGQERISLAGSMPRRREIRKLRVELLERKKAATVSVLHGAAVAAGRSAVQIPSAGS